MAEKSMKLLSPLKEGDNVFVGVSKFNKGRRDTNNLIGVVMNIEDERYKVMI